VPESCAETAGSSGTYQRVKKDVGEALRRWPKKGKQWRQRRDLPAEEL
jgi:hypothetical protein